MNRNLRLSSGTFDGLREIGGFGQPLHGLYPQIQAVLANELGPDAAWLLAEPVVDRAKNRIDWYADTDSDQKAIALADLPEEQRQAALARVDELLGQGRELADRYAASDDARRAQLGAILSAVLATPAPTEIFLVEGKPVMTGWGFMVDGSSWAASEGSARARRVSSDATSLPGAVDARGVADPGGGVGSDSVSGGVGSGAPSGENAPAPGSTVGSPIGKAVEDEPPAIVSGSGSTSVWNDRFMGSRLVWIGWLLLLLLLLLAGYWLWSRMSATGDSDRLGSPSVSTPVETGGAGAVVPPTAERVEPTPTPPVASGPPASGPSFSTPPGPPAGGSASATITASKGGEASSSTSSATPENVSVPTGGVEPRTADDAGTTAGVQPPTLESSHSSSSRSSAASASGSVPPLQRTPASGKNLEQTLSERDPAVVESLQRELAAHPPVKVEPTAEERREFASRMSESGATSGEITVTLLWNSRGDLDLVVRCPSGQQLDFRNPAECDGTLDVDANTARDKLSDRPMENAFWPAGKAGAGVYQILVRYIPRKDEEQLQEMPFQVRLGRGRQESVFKGTVRPNSLVPVTTFTVGR